MKVWMVEKVGHLCGKCGNAIGRGEVFLAIELDGVKTPKRRCAECAAASGDQPPECLELPPVARRSPDPVHPEPLRRFAAVGSMRRLQRVVRVTPKSKVKPFSLVKGSRDAKALAAGE